MPNYRPTSTGFETKGRLGRFDSQTVTLIMGVFVMSIMLSFLTIFVMGVGMLFAVTVFFVLPNVVSLYISFFLIQGKPKDYLKDWFRTHFRGHTSAQAWEDKAPPLDVL